MPSLSKHLILLEKDGFDKSLRRTELSICTTLHCSKVMDSTVTKISNREIGVY